MADPVKIKLPRSLAQRTEEVFGLEERSDRPNVLPLPLEGEWTDPSSWVAPEWVYEGAKAVTLPSHALSGGDFSDRDAMDMAFAVGGGGTAASSAVGPDDALGMFLGPKALSHQSASNKVNRGSHANQFQEAENFLWSDAERLSKLPQHELETERLAATGLFRGPDGVLRREIPDDTAFIRPQALTWSKNRVGDDTAFTDKPLGELLDHPELFENYPDLANIRVVASMGPSLSKGSGAFFPSTNQIVVNANDPDELLSVLLHEIQHPIQYHEGMGRGGNPDEFVPAWNSARNVLANRHLYDEAELQQAQEVLARGEPFDQYQNLLGEIEARDVQFRAGLNPLDQLDIPPTLLQLLKDGLYAGRDVTINQSYRPYQFPGTPNSGTP